MSNRTIGFILILVGILAIVLVIIAPSIGLASAGGFGTKRIILTAVGVIALAGGFILTMVRAKK
jgi:hypothetical protein